MKTSSHLSGFRVGFFLTCISIVIFYIGIPFFELVELKAYDLHFRAKGKRKVGSEVVIVTVDERASISLAGGRGQGQPWLTL